jgi:hypothetical protein
VALKGITMAEMAKQLEWAYPPQDAIRGDWNEPARCPWCYELYTRARAHKPACEIGRALGRPKVKR